MIFEDTDRMLVDGIVSSRNRCESWLGPIFSIVADHENGRAARIRADNPPSEQEIADWVSDVHDLFHGLHNID